MANIVLGSGSLHWTPEGGSELYLAETPSLRVRAEWTLSERYHVPAGATHRELEDVDIDGVRRVGAFLVRDVSDDSLPLWLAVAGPSRGALRFESANAHGAQRDFAFPQVVLYPDGDLDLKDRRKPVELPFAFLLRAPADGSPIWSVGAAH